MANIVELLIKTYGGWGLLVIILCYSVWRIRKDYINQSKNHRVEIKGLIDDYRSDRTDLGKIISSATIAFISLETIIKERVPKNNG